MNSGFCHKTLSDNVQRTLLYVHLQFILNYAPLYIETALVSTLVVTVKPFEILS